MKYYCENCGMEFDDSNCFNFSIEVDAPCPVCVASNALHVIPARETVAHWEKRRGEKYPDTASVYAPRESELGWFLRTYRYLSPHSIVATEAGAPPDDWRPE